MPAICLYPDNLLIEDVVLNKQNEISGWVVNGQWHYKEHAGIAYAMRYTDEDISEAVNSWKIEPRKIVVVKEKFNYDDYNRILSEHENRNDESENLMDTLDLMFIEEQNTRDKSFDMDDIPF